MTISFYNVQDDNRVVNKNLGNAVHTISNAQVYRDTSIMSPQFLVDYAGYVVNSNYVHVPSWNRYYYVTDVTAMPGGRAVMHCREDVLMSNKDAIMNLDAYVIRGKGSNRDTNMVDSEQPVRITRDCNTIKFPSTPFAASTGYCIVLSVVGGKR
jgi:hypothetical protein